jgi:hypothetical protein
MRGLASHIAQLPRAPIAQYATPVLIYGHDLCASDDMTVICRQAARASATLPVRLNLPQPSICPLSAAAATRNAV